MSLTIHPDRLEDELEQLRRRRTEQQREIRSLSLEANQDPTPEAMARVIESKSRADQLQDTIEELERQKDARRSAPRNGAAHAPSRSLTLRESPEAQATLSEIASSSSELRSYIRAGELMTQRETVAWTGRALAQTWAAGLTIPTTGIPEANVPGIITPPQQPLTLLDYFPSRIMDTRVEIYMRRQSGPGAAAVTAPGQVKPQSTIVYETINVEAEVVPVYTKANRVDLDDIDGLSSDLVQAMDYDVRHKVESLLAAEILGTSGIGAPDVSADTNTPDKILTAVGALTASGVSPNFVALSPVDATAAFKEREGVDSGYLAGSPWDRLPPIIQSPALAPGQALAGDSRIAAALGVLQGVRVAIGTESEDFIRNVVTILLEGRWAPMVFQPAALSKFTV